MSYLQEVKQLTTLSNTETQWNAYQRKSPSLYLLRNAIGNCDIDCSITLDVDSVLSYMYMICTIYLNNLLRVAKIDCYLDNSATFMTDMLLHG